MARHVTNRKPQFFLVLLGLAFVPLARGAETVNGIAALVGSSVITYEEVQHLIVRPVELFRSQFANQPEILKQRILDVQREAVERLVERRLIIQEFESLKINVPESYINDNLQDEIKKRFGDRPTLTRSL